MTKSIVRFPPSPTGFCHVGTARMALLNFMFARKHGGKIIYRSEDTDKERSNLEFEKDIIDSFTWLGLSWDEFYRQSERTAVYTEALKKLIGEGKAYLSKEESQKEKGKIVEVVRLKNPGKKITFTDIVRGDITFDTTELKDFAIARAIDDPLYHLSVVVDDALMGVTHVIRGEEHISNTPRQILIQEALGYARPAYAHYPLNLGTDRSKLSKRNGDVSVRSYREQGFLPQALVNYLGIVGWTPPSGREVMTLPEMTAEFELEELHKSGAVFDIEKLKWVNREHLMKLSDEEYLAHAKVPPKLLSLVRGRASTFGEVAEIMAELDFFEAAPSYDPKGLLWAKDKEPEKLKTRLEGTYKALEAVPAGGWNKEAVEAALMPYAEKEGKGVVLWPVRFALTGRERSPDPFTIADILGRDETLARIKGAVGRIA